LLGKHTLQMIDLLRVELATVLEELDGPHEEGAEAAWLAEAERRGGARLIAALFSAFLPRKSSPRSTDCSGRDF
jgi:hypothetical protein